MLESRKISITEALCELKLYDSKITKAVTNARYIGATKKSSDKVGVIKRDTFEANAKSGYQSVTDLISNRNKLKSAIVQSNAITEVEVAGNKMTVAEAIERKSSIEYDETLLIELKRQYATATDTVLKENKKVDTQVDKMLETFMGKDSDKKIGKDDQDSIVEPYRIKNEFELVDPLDLLTEIQKLENDIEEFKANIDICLTLSNSTVFIEI